MWGVRYSHAEVSCAAKLSVVASLTPYSDFIQSPRNMYHCQMGKQTMGTLPGVHLAWRLPLFGAALGGDVFHSTNGMPFGSSLFGLPC